MKPKNKYFFCLLFFAGMSFIFSQNKKIDSLKILLKTDKEDTNKVNHLNNFGWELRQSNPDTAIIISNQALAIAEKVDWKKGIANAFGHLGAYNYIKADYPKALHYYFKALKMAEELEDKQLQTKNLSNIGNVYNSQADYPKALDYYFKALKMNEELGDKNGIAINLGNIGVVYMEQADYPKALDYYFKALKMAEELGNKNRIAINLGNIGSVYNSKTDYPKALDYYFKALKMAEELGNKNAIAINLGNIGSVYLSQTNYPKASPTERNQSFGRALDYYFKALKMVEELGNKNAIAGHLGNIGGLYSATKKYAEAEKYLLEALKLSKEIGALHHEKSFEKSLSKLYSETNRFELALTHYKKFIIASDSIASDENAKKQIRSEMNFEFEKKEALTKAEQEKKDLVASEEKTKQKLFLWFTIAGLGIVLVVAVFIFRSLRINKKKNKIITE
ncbi:MAG: tetratricopeptide repeat protein, partial [Bacteroidia bacterium]|nr:tetratricopeptide repeat protein [Bacteroidia bacterium]